MAQICYGIVGRNGSGKSTVCDYLISKGYHSYSLSDVVRQHAQQAGITPDRDGLTQLANQLKSTHGMDYFAQSVMDDVLKHSHDFVVFDSIRHPSEIDFLRAHQVVFVGVHAPLKDCYDRIVERKKERILSLMKNLNGKMTMK